MNQHSSSSSNTEDGQHLPSPSSCPSCGSSSRPLLTCSNPTQSSIERLSVKPNASRDPRLRYLDPDDPFDLRDLEQAIRSRHRSLLIVPVAVLAAALLLAWALMDSEGRSVLDTAVGVARRD